MNWNQFINHQKMWMHSPFTFTIHFFRSELIYESEIVKNHQISICPTLDCVRSTRISKVCLASPTIFGHLYDFYFLCSILLTFNTFSNSNLSFTDDIKSVSVGALSHDVVTFFIYSLKNNKNQFQTIDI